ncbi:MAG TPA: hypothetical protein VMR31_06565 [Myxococcota bacterium]|nr:hypothetical protein [Myxococcota bacterium]
MGDPQVIGARILAIALVCSACAWLPEPLERPFRKPGVRLVDFPEKVSQQFDCPSQKLPWFKLETLEVWPKRIDAGNELGHRMIYVLCTDGPTDVVTGRLDTKIMYRGQPILRESDASYDLRAGRWSIDVFVTVPPDAPEGLYALQLDFKSATVKFSRSETFAVSAKPPPAAPATADASKPDATKKK